MLQLSAVSSTYTAAQSIVADIEANRVWEGAFVTLSQFVGSELAEVAEKSIALGADPDVIHTLLGSIQSAEVIEVTGEAPKPVSIAPQTKPIPWLWLLLGIAAIGGVVYYANKQKSAT